MGLRLVQASRMDQSSGTETEENGQDCVIHTHLDGQQEVVHARAVVAHKARRVAQVDLDVALRVAAKEVTEPV